MSPLSNAAGSIGNSNDLFHHPRAHHRAPQPSSRWGPRLGAALPPSATRPRRVCPRALHAPGSHAPATPALSGLALRTCLGLGERLQALRCEPGERERLVQRGERLVQEETPMPQSPTRGLSNHMYLTASALRAFWQNTSTGEV
jgi:hypothetical protein